MILRMAKEIRDGLVECRRSHVALVRIGVVTADTQQQPRKIV